MRRGLAFLLLLVACGEPDYPPTAEGLFLRHCSRCHEADGSSATASKLAKTEVDLRDPKLHKQLSNGEIEYIIEFGVGRMQGIAGLGAAEVDSIVLHLRTLDSSGSRP